MFGDVQMGGKMVASRAVKTIIGWFACLFHFHDWERKFTKRGGDPVMECRRCAKTRMGF